MSFFIIRSIRKIQWIRVTNLWSSISYKKKMFTLILQLFQILLLVIIKKTSKNYIHRIFGKSFWVFLLLFISTFWQNSDKFTLCNFRILASPLIIEGSEKTTGQQSLTSGSLTIANMEIIECLIDRASSDAENNGSTTTIIELLAFEKDCTSAFAFANTANLRMNFKFTEKTVKRAQVYKHVHSRSDFE